MNSKAAADMCTEKLRKIHNKTLMSELLFHKVSSLKPTIFEKRFQYRYFLVNILRIFNVLTKHRNLSENFQEKSM